jgi:hypothetical protein
MGTDFERRLSSEHFGRAEGPCATSRRFHEAVLQVIVSPSWDRLFVITGEALISRSRSSPFLMGWWSAQCNYFT